jgi:phosphodiesterase/alkaline phosphatase D-like protein
MNVLSRIQAKINGIRAIIIAVLSIILVPAVFGQGTQISFHLPDSLIGAPTGFINVPVTFNGFQSLDSVTAENPLSFEMTIVYPGDSLTYAGLDFSTAVRTGAVTDFRQAGPDTVVVAFIDTEPIVANSGILVNMQFNVNASIDDLLPLSMIDMEINEWVSDGLLTLGTHVMLDSGSIFVSNYPPVFQTATIPTFTQNVLSTITVAAFDADGDSLFFSLPDSTQVPGAAIVDSTANPVSITWTPADSQIYIAGTDSLIQHVLTVRMREAGGTTHDTTLTLGTVINANDPPVWHNAQPDTIFESRLDTIYFAASDPDLDPVTFQLLSPSMPDSMMGPFSTGGDSVYFVWTPSPTQIGFYSLFMEVNDGQGGVTQDSVFIYVRDSNNPPVFISSPILTVPYGQTYNYTVQIQDADRIYGPHFTQNMNFTFRSWPGGAMTMTPEGPTDTETAAIQWTPSGADIGTHQIEIRVQDGANTVSHQWVITVTGPRPVFIPVAEPLNVNVDVLFELILSASSPANLTFNKLNGPGWLGLDGSTGQLSGTPAAANIGDNVFTFRVTDGLQSDTLGVNIFVADPSNVAPALVNPPGAQIVEALTAFTLQLQATDSDNGPNPVSYTLTSAPTWLTFDAVAGLFSGTPAESDVGTVTVSGNLSDGAANVPFSFTLTVELADIPIVNEPPFWLSIPDTLYGQMGHPLDLLMQAGDANDSLLTFLPVIGVEPIDVPPGMALVSSGPFSAQLQWPAPMEGVFVIQLQVTDGVTQPVLRSVVIKIESSTTVPPDSLSVIFTQLPHVLEITDQTALVRWETDRATTGFLFYGIDSTSMQQIDITVPVAFHEMLLDGLLPNQAYQYRVQAIGTDGTGPVSPLDVFVTTSTTVPPDSLPVIFTQLPHVVDITEQSAMVRWETDRPTTGLLFYGIDSTSLQQIDISVPVAFHEIFLDGLLPNQAYQYRVQAIGTDGTGPVSPLETFVTVTGGDTLPEELAVTGVLPSEAPNDIPIILQIFGLAFQPDATINVGALSLENIEFISPGELRGQLPPGGPIGLHPVRVTNPDGLFAELSAAFNIVLPLPDTIPPVFTAGPQVFDITAISARISWVAEEPVQWYVEFGPDSLDTIRMATPDPVMQIDDQLSGLHPDQHYVMRVGIADVAGNLTVSPWLEFLTEPAFPVIHAVLPSVVRNDKPVDLQILGDYFQPGIEVAVGTTILSNVQYHNSQEIFGHLPAGHPDGRYTIHVTNPDGLLGMLDSALTILQPPPDTIAPVFTLPPHAKGITQNSAVIGWGTDEPALGFVQFGPDTLTLQRLDLPDMLVQHEIQLPDLDSGQDYVFRVGVSDGPGNNRISPFQLFTTTFAADTLPPFIEGPVVLNVTDTRATIAWRTPGEPAHTALGYREFGTEAPFDSIMIPDLSFEHQVEIDDLAPTTQYEYRVASVDASGNRAVRTADEFGEPLTFTTDAGPDLLPPTVRAVRVEGVTEQSAWIIWETDEPSTSIVETGFTDQYELGANTDTSFSNLHQVNLVNLNAEALYHFRVRSVDVAGNYSPALTGTFQTLAVPDTLGPYISPQPIVVQVSDHAATISWGADELSDSFVEFVAEGDTIRHLRGDPAPVPAGQSHVVNVDGLLPDTRYFYTVSSRDLNGNVTVVQGLDSPFRTKAAADTLAPVLVPGGTPHVIGLTENQAIIEWKTNELSGSRVQFGTHPDSLVQVVNNPDPVFLHHVMLENLSPGQSYLYRVSSADAAGNVFSDAAIYGFQTEFEADVQPPDFEKLPVVVEVTDQGATIAWETSEIADGFVEYRELDAPVFQSNGSADLTQYHAVQLTGLLPDTPYEFRVISVDASGNDTSLVGLDSPFRTKAAADTLPPAFVPGGQPVVVGITDASAVIEWHTNEISDSRVRFGLDTARTEALWDLDARREHTISLLELESGAHYFYTVSSTDNAGNTFVSQIFTFSTLSLADTIAPTLTQLPTVTGITQHRAVVQWGTDEIADSFVEYYVENGDPYVRDVGFPDLVQDHVVSLNDLIPDTTYVVTVRSTDAGGNTVEWPGGNFRTRAFADTVAPALSASPNAVSITEHSAIIEWGTNETADSRVQFGLDSTLTQGALVDAERVQHHTLYLDELEPGLRYLYRVQSSDPSGNQFTGITREFRTLTARDTIAPSMVVSPQVVGISDRQAALKWQTNENADSYVEYQEMGVTDDALLLITGRPELTIDHFVLMTGLLPETEYRVRAVSTDGEGNRFSAPFIFYTTEAEADTLPPRIVGAPSSISLTESSIQIEWQTNEPATSAVLVFSDTTGDITPLAYNSPGMSIEHAVPVTELMPGARYYYRVKSRDASGNEVTGKLGDFLTVADQQLAPPVFEEGPVVNGITNSAATIRWRTDITADGVVELRPDEAVGLDTIPRVFALSDLSTEHIIVLTELLDSTNYQYTVSSTSPAGLTQRMEGFEFRTLAVVDTLPPQIISGPLVVNRDEQSGTIQWHTDEPASSFVRFGVDSLNQTELHGDAAPVGEHVVVLSNLESDTRYWYRVESVDLSGNLREGLLKSFATRAGADVFPPVVQTGPIAVGVTSDQAIIQWTTDEPAVSRVEFGLDTVATSRFVEFPDQVTGHDIRLTNLVADTLYYYRIRSADAAGNQLFGQLKNFRTDAAADTLAPYIQAGPLVTSKTASGAVIEWSTDEESDSFVDYLGGDGVQQTVGDAGKMRQHTLSISNLAADTWYYYNVRSTDLSGNTVVSVLDSLQTDAAADTLPPLLIAGPEILGQQTDRATIRWVTDEMSDSFVRYDTTDQNFLEETGRPEDVTDHRMDLNNLKAGARYYYQMVSEDPTGNAYISEIFDFESPAAADETPPFISGGPSIIAWGSNTVTVAWTTDESATSEIQYALQENVQEALAGITDQLPVEPKHRMEVLQSDYATEHQLTVTNLTAATEYIYQVRSTDPSGNSQVSPVLSLTTKAVEDTTAPAFLRRPHVTSRMDRTVALHWQTDELADSFVRFGTVVTDGIITGGDDMGDGEKSRHHGMTLTNLEPATQYFYQVRSSDFAGNTLTSEILEFETRSAADEQPPVIELGPYVKNITEQNASIEWKTNEVASSKVVFGTESDKLNKSAGSADLVDVHLVALANLESGVRYYYQVQSDDMARNKVESTVKSFYTESAADETPPAFLQVPFISNITSNSATVKWVTDEGSVGAVLYGQDDTYSEGLVEIPEIRNDHIMTLTGLVPGAAYRLYVRVRDVSGNEANTQTTPLEFLTETEQDVQPPQIINGPIAENITTSTATVRWTTDEASDSFIRFGRNQNQLDQEEGSGELTLEHVFTLTDLELHKKYYFQIQSRDIAGNISDVGRHVHEFRTLRNLDVTPPVITAGPIVHATDRAASYEWETDEPSDSYVFYRKADDGPDALFEKVGSPEYLQQHRVAVVGLELGSAYEFFLASSDFAGNAVVFPDVFEESLYKSSLEQKINQPPGGSGSFRTRRSVDNTAPQIIDGPDILNKTATTITLGWDTDEAGDSFVEFETLGKATTTNTLSQIVGDGANVVDHTVTLTNLDSATTYRYVVRSADINQNGPTRSRESSVTTLQLRDVEPPVIELGPIVSAITDRQATIIWETDEPADSYVEFGFDTTFGNPDTLAADYVDSLFVPNLTRQLTEDVTVHKVTLTNLIPDTTYVFHVASVDLAGNGPTTSFDTMFATQAGPDTIPPAFVVAPHVVSSTDQTVTVSWTTDELSDSFVRYDSAAAVGKRIALRKAGVNVELYENNVGSVDDVTEHVVTLTGLGTGTEYMYGVGSIDKSNQETITAVPLSFTTAAAPDTLAPEVPANVEAIPGNESVYLRWSAIPNIAGDLSGYNIYRAEIVGGTIQGDFVEVASQVPETNYYDEGRPNDQTVAYRVTSLDNVTPMNNESESSELIFTTPSLTAIPPAPVPVGPLTGEIANSVTPVFSFSNGEGVRPLVSGTVAISIDSTFLTDVVMVTDIPLGDVTSTYSFPSELQPQTVYYWRSRTFDGIFNGPWSDVQSFSIELVTAVELQTFEGVGHRNIVTLHWETALETDNLGFNIFRRRRGETEFEQINRDMLFSNGNDSFYEFADTEVEIGAEYRYRLEAVDVLGRTQELGQVVVAVEVPKTFVLHANYPNPFNPVTQIRFDLPTGQKVSLQIYDILGRHIATVVDNQPLDAGYYQFAWNGANRNGLQVASGVYLYRIQAGRFVKTRKMLLLK